MEKKSRVVVTGLGVFTNLGQSVDELWAGLKSGKVGYVRVNEGDTHAIGVIEFDKKRWSKKFPLLKGENCLPLGLNAVEQAIGDANYVPHL